MPYTEFAENGSIYDYIHEEHKKPPLSQILLWAAQVAEGMYLWPVKVTNTDARPLYTTVASYSKIL